MSEPIAVGTHKAIHEFLKRYPDGIFNGIKFKTEPTHYAYINLMSGWTEQECDDTVYFLNLPEHLVKTMYIQEKHEENQCDHEGHVTNGECEKCGEPYESDLDTYAKENQH